jgi:hypothetical protein
MKRNHSISPTTSSKRAKDESSETRTLEKHLEIARHNFENANQEIGGEAQNYISMLENRVDEQLQLAQNQVDQMREHLTCSICLELLQYPHVLSCGHSFCPDCLQQVFQATKRSCPSCRAPVASKPARNLALSGVVSLHAANLPTEERQAWLRRHERLVEEFGDGQQDAWHPHFQRQMVQALDDADDGVLRCGLCAWEIADGICENPECGQQYDIDGLAMDNGDAIADYSEWSDDISEGEDLADFLSERSGSPDSISTDEDWPLNLPAQSESEGETDESDGHVENDSDSEGLIVLQDSDDSGSSPRRSPRGVRRSPVRRVVSDSDDSDVGPVQTSRRGVRQSPRRVILSDSDDAQNGTNQPSRNVRHSPARRPTRVDSDSPVFSSDDDLPVGNKRRGGKKTVLSLSDSDINVSNSESSSESVVESFSPSRVMRSSPNKPEPQSLDSDLSDKPKKKRKRNKKKKRAFSKSV